MPNDPNSGGGSPRAPAFTVQLRDEVLAFLREADAETIWYWNVSLRYLADDPFARYGYHSERIAGGLPSRTYNFWIGEITFGAGQRGYVFTAEYWDYRPVYIVDPVGREIIFIGVRAAWVYDPIDK